MIAGAARADARGGTPDTEPTDPRTVTPMTRRTVVARRPVLPDGRRTRESRSSPGPASRGAEGNRTPGLDSAIVALYQLSYSPDGRDSGVPAAAGDAAHQTASDQRSPWRCIDRAVERGPVGGGRSDRVERTGRLTAAGRALVEAVGGASTAGAPAGAAGRGGRLERQLALAQLAEHVDVAAEGDERAAEDVEHGVRPSSWRRGTASSRRQGEHEQHVGPAPLDTGLRRGGVAGRGGALGVAAATVAAAS